MKHFLKSPTKDSESQRRSYSHRQRGLHFYFRHMNQRMQIRFSELVEHDTMPTAFIHGNPHLDNYAKNAKGAAMVDFDRSRLGPYAYDLVRFLISVSLRGDRPSDLIPPTLIESLRRGYVQGLLCPELGYEEMLHLREKKPKRWQTSTRAYMASDRMWAAKLRRYPTTVRTAKMTALLDGYLESRNELDLLDRYKVTAGARVAGSLGKYHHLFLLEPKKGDDDFILLDVKEVYDERNNRWYRNPFDHNGKRMIAAGNLHAPGWDLRPGFATHRGKQYWGRQIPTQNAKFKKLMREPEQMEICFAVASQLGRAHHLSVRGIDHRQLFEHFQQNYPTFIMAAQVMKRELESAYDAYMGELLAA